MPSSMPRVSMSSKSKSSYILSFDYSYIVFVIPYFGEVGKGFTKLGFYGIIVIVFGWWNFKRTL